MNVPKTLRTFRSLTLIMLLVPTSLSSASVTAGHFEMYCDGIGIFLTKIEGAPAPGKLVLFSALGFPPGTMGGVYFGQGQWSTISVFRDGCFPDGKCTSIGDGRVWIDAPDKELSAPKYISGKFEINLNGSRLAGTFRAKRRVTKRPLHVCM